MPSNVTWPSVDPEERTILTANRVNVKNQKIKKELALKKKGIETEMKCDNIIHTKNESMMQNRLDRLAKASDSVSCNRLMICTPFSSASSDNWLPKTDKDSTTSRGSTPSKQKRSPETNKPNDGANSSGYQVNDNEERKERHVRFGRTSSLNLDKATTLRNASPKSVERISLARKSGLEYGHQSDSVLGYGREPGDDIDDSNSTNTLLQRTSLKNGINNSSALHLQKRSSIGFSTCSLHGNSSHNLTRRNSLKVASGLEDEMARWRRHHHTRAINARIKAVRHGGKRHGSSITLRDAMDNAAAVRKAQAYHPEPFTAERAWGLLNCEYLRLTPSNVAALEEICSKAGYDVSIHPHKTKEDLEQEMKNMFKELRESRKLLPDVTSQLRFRQSLLFKRISSGFNAP